MKRESGRWSWVVDRISGNCQIQGLGLWRGPRSLKNKVVVLSDGIGVVKEYSKVNEKQERVMKRYTHSIDSTLER
jgi:hypothetical protein